MDHNQSLDKKTLSFITLLSETLDIEAACKELGLSKADARAILNQLASLVSSQTRPVFDKTVQQKTDSPSAASAVRRPDHKAILTIYVDGASRGNPGLAGAGAVIKDSEGAVIKKLKKFLGSVTNNVAEYQALIMALEAADRLGVANLRIFADSELMVKQINGVYQVKSPDLKPLYNRAASLIKLFSSVKLSHVMREQNSLADAMANEAIDKRDERQAR